MRMQKKKKKSRNKITNRMNMGIHAWVEYLDEESGGLYYHNEDTGEITWEQPKGFRSQNKTSVWA